MSRHWRLDDSWIAIEPAPGAEDGLRRSFADEVAIDFPSMREAVARIRLSFGDDDREPPLVAEIALSTRQAHRGAAVPIDVPLRRTCRACGGRGEVWSEHCGHCDGQGQQLHTQRLTVSVPRGVTHGDRFSFSVSLARGPRTRVDVRVAVTA